MARYIDAAALLENLKKQYGEELGWQCTVNMSDVGMMIEDAPTADVVPKSEVEREVIDLLEEIYDFFKQTDSIREAYAILFAIAELKKKYTEGEK